MQFMRMYTLNNQSTLQKAHILQLIIQIHSKGFRQALEFVIIFIFQPKAFCYLAINIKLVLQLIFRKHIINYRISKHILELL